MKNILTLLAVCMLFVSVACSNGKKDNAADNAIKSDTVIEAESGAEEVSSDMVADNYKVVDGGLVSINNRPLLVDFSATWCMPCREFKPIFEKVSKSFDGIVDFCSIDVDNNKELAEKYEITSIPCLVYISADGKEIGRSVGLLDASELNEKIKSHFDL